ncbi:MAG: hypothetical protein A3B96_01070 [Candidatus Spechtbacteria bacterium RIFCSPHIGHO2_02_FULL_43_15b]|uniref:Predicted 3'-5' exonuclease PolB-like domain-containing protein n=1 Tax=Candidatus Spechtbacteria bacterium RIFCSPHIGHO2_01_FULL_43_30 TaxID=1802158 RepID=A0A1G2H5V3_9BACT|nr:MAG: hypothetical protein A2827_03470 [Candidatus Spechtbacteria bacterium RIFCSPHIGHO2_01_FULL_43_30]OGZ59005.1 MAG: hypothetical protein A3B96_01070 [Candidatus Spechtbacteria bacterium RIFCSPHIGHO2_02_FULL_43_15b]
MSYLVLDIETIGKKYEDFDETSIATFKKWAGRDAESDEQIEKGLENIKKGLPLSPFLGEIVAIGMLDDKNKGAVYFRRDGSHPDATGSSDFEESGIHYWSGTEKEILERFWEVARNYFVFVTFNGRCFDAPYLLIRSAIWGIKPSRNLMPNRYVSMQKYGPQHIDLSDQFTFYGAIRRTGLHFAAKAFGVKSPKDGDITGEEVPKAFEDGKYEEIARYCFEDVITTKKLFETWGKLLNFETNFTI